MCGAHTRVAALVAALVAGDLRKPVSSVKKHTNACMVCKETYECLEKDVRMPGKRPANAWYRRGTVRARLRTVEYG